jgi:hypothetical protein
MCPKDLLRLEPLPAVRRARNGCFRQAVPQSGTVVAVGSVESLLPRSVIHSASFARSAHIKLTYCKTGDPARLHRVHSFDSVQGKMRSLPRVIFVPAACLSLPATETASLTSGLAAFTLLLVLKEVGRR